MTNPVLLIYDNTGRVWAVYHGETTVPSGVQGIIADAPKNYVSVTVNPATRTATFVEAPETETEVENLQDALIELEARVSALEEV